MTDKDLKTTGPEAHKHLPKNPVGEAAPVSAHIDNAHASGLGAMGRNDEKLPTGADGTEGAEGPGPEEPAY